MKQIINQVKNDPQTVQRIMQSQDGQKLLQMLTRNDGGQRLNQATNACNNGNTADMVQMLKTLMQSPEGSQLINRIGNQLNK